MLRVLDSKDPILKTPGLFNAYPFANEISMKGCTIDPVSFKKKFTDFYIDDQYGRLMSSELLSCHPYGKSNKLDHYSKIDELTIVDELRIPFRRIPIYSIDRVQNIQPFVERLTQQNKSHKILLRGQVKTYLLERPDGESNNLYGGPVEEPSFLSSHLRASFDEHMLKSLWHSLSSMLLDEACIDKISDDLTAAEGLRIDAHRVRRTVLFDLFALGIAQHYGLPSVGLDLTNNVAVASWFALNRIVVDVHGHAKSLPVEMTDSPTIFVFRCPADAVFDYELVRPKILGGGRPVMQHAWFGHVGWGQSMNQLGSYLVCGFRLAAENAEDLEQDYWRRLFPDLADDYILAFFEKMKKRDCYVGEAKRALDRLYAFQH